MYNSNTKVVVCNSVKQSPQQQQLIVAGLSAYFQ